MADEPLPTVGQIVLYGDYSSGRGRPAIVCAVSGDVLDLCVFLPMPAALIGVRKSEKPGLPWAGCWTWPPRAPEPERPPAPVVGGKPIPAVRICPHCGGAGALFPAK